MRRYEGMDELLRGVRERLQVATQHAPEAVSLPEASPPPAGRVPLPRFDSTYETAVTRLKALSREVEDARELIASEDIARLSDEQRDHLLAIVHQAMEELWTCEATIQGVR